MTADLHRVAADVFGWTRLRPAQIHAMEAVLSGRDVLAVMATGSGKSAIYQVPGVLLDGLTLVISPLIALQRDQISGLAATGAPDAVAINSLQDADESDRAWTALRDRAAEYVFLAPEQLDNEQVLAALSAAGISLIVVDEAHCVASWGHDFRPSYLRIADAVQQLGHPTVVALTATASPLVRREIVDRLGLRDPLIVASGFDRPNIRLEVSHHVDDDDKRSAVLAAARAAKRPSLLYTATRADAEYYAAQLNSDGVRALAYHAGRSRSDRDTAHARFRAGEVDVVAATSAFGMGIDKSDVRAVLHASVPDSLDNYYQQIGRAGRDGRPALAHLFYRPEDLGLGRFFASRNADPPLLACVYAAVQSADEAGKTSSANDIRAQIDVPAGRSGATRGMVPAGRSGATRGMVPAGRSGATRGIIPERRVTNALNLLEQAGLIRGCGDGFEIVRHTGLDDAVAAAAAVVERLERIDRTRVEMMRGYAETRDCRRQFLLGYFGEDLDRPCGNCDRCDGNTGRTAQATAGPWAADLPVMHRDWGPGVVMSVDDDRMTVLFDDYGYRTLLLASVEESGVLTPLSS